MDCHLQVYGHVWSFTVYYMSCKGHMSQAGMDGKGMYYLHVQIHGHSHIREVTNMPGRLRLSGLGQICIVQI